MQKFMLALFGASMCVLASAQYGKYDQGSQSDGYKTEIKHSWQEKDYKNDDKYGKSEGYGKHLEGQSSRYFVLESKKGYEPKYESRKYESDDNKYGSYKMEDSYKKYEDKYEEPKKYEIRYEEPKKYEVRYEEPKKYEIRYEEPKKYEVRYEPKKYETYKMEDSYKSNDNKYEPMKYEATYEPKYETKYESDDKYESKYENSKSKDGWYGGY